MSARPGRLLVAAVAATTALALVIASPMPANSEALSGAASSTLAREGQTTPQDLGAGDLDGLQYADPGSQINLMQPPQANSHGSAAISFPLDIPAGRAGMQPDLTLSYDSSAGDGWMGMGWNLDVGSVGVDTRWGVPRYLPDKESETYTLDGEVLSPTAVRSTFAQREPERDDFSRRVDTERERITRHGTNPKNYWWEVEDKAGNHRYYGGEPLPDGTEHRVPAAILTDDHDNAYRWGLTAETDVSSNIVRYSYEEVDGTGVGHDQETLGRQMYLKSVEYTGSLAKGVPDDPAYKVVFTRDKGAGDHIISGRGGFLEVTSDRLASVSVYYGAPATDGSARPTHDVLSGRYTFSYDTGPFGKSLLTSVGRAGSDGNVYATHRLDYYDDAQDPAGVYQGFAAAQDWKTGDDGLGDILDVGALGGSVSNAGDVHAYLGFNPADPLKVGSFGGSLTISGGATEGVAELMDINGDMLPDKVFRSGPGKTVQYRLNTSGPGASGTPTFGAAHQVIDQPVDQLSTEAHVGFGGGPEAYPGVAVQFGIGADFAIGEDYFTDVNNDGLPDFVHAGDVFFNHLGVTGVPTFGSDSGATSVPIDDGTVDIGTIERLKGLAAQARDQSPLQDTVRRWVAPYSGTVSVAGAATYDPRDDTGKSWTPAHGDGVRVAIQRNGDELWHAGMTTPGATVSPTGVGGVTVQRGDHIYFRVQSVDDGAGDRVDWQPVIDYTSVQNDTSTAPADVNGRSQTRYDAKADFTLAGRPHTTVLMPLKGTVHLAGALVKPSVTTDDVTVQVIRNGAVIWHQTIPAGHASTTPVDVATDFDVAAPDQDQPGSGDRIQVRLAVDSPIDVSDLSWTPQLYYTSATAGGKTLDVTQTVDIRDENGTFLRTVTEPTYQVQIPPDIDVYPQSTAAVPVRPWTSTVQGAATATAGLSLAGDHPAGYAVLTVKQRGVLVAKKRLGIAADATSIGTADLAVDLDQGEDYWFAITVPDPQISEKVLGSSVKLSWKDGDATTSATVPSTRYWAGRQGVFPLAYRGWAYAGYDGDGDRASQPIVESDFEFDQDDFPDSKPTGWNSDGSYKDPAKGKSFAFIPTWLEVRNADGTVKQQVPVWQGAKDNLLGGADFASSSRTGVDSPDSLQPTPGGDARATRRLAVTGPTFSLTAGLGPLSASFAGGTSFGLLDYLDMNGDSFPDVVAPGKVQYTGPRGGYLDHHDAADVVRQDATFAVGGGFSGAPIGIKANALGNTTAAGKNSTVSNGKAAAGPGAASKGGEASHDEYGVSIGAGLSINAQFSNPNTQDVGGDEGFSDLPDDAVAPFERDLADMNGDGLPDRVKAGVDGVTVELNLGYGYSDPIAWAKGGFETGASYSGSITPNLGFEINDKAFSGGVSDTESVDLSSYSWADVNGDGIADRLHQTGGKVMVAFGNGSSLAKEVQYGTMAEGTFELSGGLPDFGDIPLGQQSAVGRTRGIGGGADFTFGIGPLCIAACYIIVNPGAHYDHSVSTTQVALTDVNGDGYPDSVKSTEDSGMSVRLNNHGRTNLLKSVANPLGGSFELDYRRGGNSVAQPYSQWLLGSVTTKDGRPGDGPDTLLTTFAYQGNSFNALERELLGFSTVTETQREFAGDADPYDDPVLRSVQHEYLNGNVFESGLETSTTLLRADGTRAKQTRNSWSLIDLATGEPADLAPATADPAGTRLLRMAVAPQLASTTQSWFRPDSSLGEKTTTVFAYDGRGNLVQQIDGGESETDADNLVALTTYSDCLPGSWLSIPATFVVHEQSATGPVLRQRDGSADLCANGAPTKIVESVSSGSTVTSTMTFDSWGNYNQVVHPGPDGQADGYTVDYTYDGDRHTDIAKTVDSHGLTATAEYDGSTGLVTSRTDANSQVTSYGYDPQSRMVSITGPYQQGSDHHTVDFSYHPGDTPGLDDYSYAVASHFDVLHPDDPIQTVAFVDGLGRQTETKQDATVFTGRDNPGGNDVMAVGGAIEFDSLGRLVKQWYPTTEPLGTISAYNTNLSPVPPVQTTYDVADRVTKEVRPSGATTTHDYGFGGSADLGSTVFTTTTTDNAGNQQRRYSDVRDNTLIVDALPQDAPRLRTRYAYDGLSQLLSVTDPGGNTTTHGYDLLGHVTSTDTPDAGLVQDTYDGAGNLVRKVDANLRAAGQAISYTYDQDRLTAIDHPDGTPDVHYSYGDAGAAGNAAGRVTVVDDGARHQELTYDPLGAVASERSTMKLHNLNDETAESHTYTTDLSYDAFGRLLTLDYPDGEVLTHGYDSGGLLDSLVGEKAGHTYTYLDRLEYDQFQDRRFQQTGNGVWTEYTYGTKNRLVDRIQTVTPDREVQDLNYSYDKVGNVTQADNALPAPEPSLYGGPSTQSYQYDPYYRLVSANGHYAFQGKKQRRYSSTLTLDDLGNITSKTQTDEISDNGRKWLVQQPTTYTLDPTYGAEGPHQVTHNGTRSYTHDAGGNLTGWTDDETGQRRIVTWDATGHASSVADNGSTTRYTYDDTGRLAIERGPGGEKAFVNQWYTVLNGEIAWKDVFAGTDRIATQKAMPDGELEQKRYFLHKDLQGSTNVITDPEGLVFEHLEYFPGGETWVLEHSDIHRTPYLYAGGYLDEVRGLINLGQRWYDPREEFLYSPDPALTQDPRAVVDDPSLLPAYTYAESNPVRLTDPDGRAPTSVRDRLRSDFDKFDTARKINAALASGGSDQRVGDTSRLSPLWRFATSDGGKRWTALSKALDSAPLVKLEFAQSESGWGLRKVTISPLLISAASKEFTVGGPEPAAGAATAAGSSPPADPGSVVPSGAPAVEQPGTVRSRPRAASAPAALGSAAHGGGAAPEPLPESP